ncbi:hypothetical protein D1O33_20550 [Rhodococcus rhodochrous]|nr:hypothetical protein D1O33_20550 [Rhodococcus rhodochrous]QOH56183.1 hypothetical protein C6Y44_09600 [Rhodococcus rhodochrous]
MRCGSSSNPGIPRAATSPASSNADIRPVCPFVSDTSFVGPGALRRITPDGSVTTVLPEVTGPGGIVVEGPTVYLNVGNTTVSRVHPA